VKILPALAVLLFTVACSAPALAGTTRGASTGSERISESSAEVVGGTISVAAMSGVLVIDSISRAADGSVIVLKDASGAVKVSLRVSGDAVGKASLAVGGAVSLVAISTGHLLVASGKAIAFIPNEIGKTLIHHTRVDKAGE
jgi:hypothetical protein